MVNFLSCGIFAGRALKEDISRMDRVEAWKLVPFWQHSIEFL